MKKLPFKSNVPKDFDIAKKYKPVLTEQGKEDLKKQREENGWHEKNNARLQNPEYHTKLSKSIKNSEIFQESRKKLKGNEEFKESIKKGLEEYNKKNPEHKQKQIDRTIKQNKDLKWLESVTQGNRNKRLDKDHVDKMNKMYKTKEWKEAHLKGVQLPETRKKHQQGVLLKIAKPIVTKEGIFISKTEATKYILENNILPTRKTLMSISAWLSSKIKSNPKDYYYITKEEYTRLTGKDIK